MKPTSLIALTLALAPLAAHAQNANPFGTMLRAMVDQTVNACKLGRREFVQTMLEARLRDVDPARTPTIEAFCADAQAQDASAGDSGCYATCAQTYAGRFEQALAGAQSRARAHAEFAAQQQEKESQRAQESAAAATREADLRAQRVQPASGDEAALFYNARPGDGLASAPKIRPDGALYYLHGAIKTADGERPEFFANALAARNQEIAQRLMGRAESTSYFGVTVPKPLRSYYFDNAKIEGGFDLVGRYVANKKYTTVAGQEKLAPVFEAVYFRMW